MINCWHMLLPVSMIFQFSFLKFFIVTLIKQLQFWNLVYFDSKQELVLVNMVLALEK